MSSGIGVCSATSIRWSRCNPANPIPRVRTWRSHPLVLTMVTTTIVSHKPRSVHSTHTMRINEVIHRLNTRQCPARTTKVVMFKLLRQAHRVNHGKAISRSTSPSNGVNVVCQHCLPMPISVVSRPIRTKSRSGAPCPDNSQWRFA